MKVRSFFICFLWCAAIGWLALCFYLSSQSLANTSHLSISITRLFIKTMNLPEEIFFSVHDSLRMLAHVVVFFMLALFIGAAYGVTFRSYKRFPFGPFLLSFGISVLDEVHKVFIPGRHCSVFEMGLNVIGCLIGSLAIYFVFLKMKNTM